MNKTMNKTELIRELADTTGDSRRTVEAVLMSAGYMVAAMLREGGEVTLPVLGKFSARDHASRTGRNPATGEAVEIPARRVPHFRASKALKDIVGGITDEWV